MPEVAIEEHGLVIVPRRNADDVILGRPLEAGVDLTLSLDEPGSLARGRRTTSAMPLVMAPPRERTRLEGRWVA